MQLPVKNIYVRYFMNLKITNYEIVIAYFVKKVNFSLHNF